MFKKLHGGALRWLRSLMLLLVAGLGVPVTLVVLLIGGGLVWSSVFPDTIRIPVTARAEVVLERVHIHPFLAEYDRAVLLKVDGQTRLGSPIPMNTGGRTNIKVFVGHQTMKLQDRQSTTWINVTEPCLMDSYNPSSVDPAWECSRTARIRDPVYYMGRIVGVSGGMALRRDCPETAEKCP